MAAESDASPDRVPGPRSRAATLALTRLRAGRAGASEELFQLVYADLKRIAERSMGRERQGHTLQPTALVHEAYLELIDDRNHEWRDRSHFLGVAALCIRRILVAHARDRAALKRGGHLTRIGLDASLELRPSAPGHDTPDEVDLLALDEALDRLRALDERQAKVVELRFFGGLSVAECGAVLSVSERTVKSDWQVARLWLHRELA